MTPRSWPHPAAADIGSPARREARIAGPADLVQAVPYLLGFHPYASLVLVGLDDGRLIVTARVDLADVTGSDGPAFTTDTLSAIARGGAGALVALVFADHGPRSPGQLRPTPDPVVTVGAAAAAVGLSVLDIVAVAGGRWRSLLCDSECCPPAGTAVPGRPSEFATAATVDGVAPLPDRDSVERRFEPAPAERRRPIELLVRAAAGQGCGDRTAVRRLFAAARASGATNWVAPAPQASAEFAVALARITVRDAVWMGVDDGRLHGGTLWLHLGRHLPAPYAAAPLFLYAWAAWRAGDGAEASIAARQAVTNDPGYSAADLLLAALAHGVDPRRLPRLRLPRSA